MTDLKLLDCPFCGGEAELLKMGSGLQPQTVGFGKHGNSIICTTCRAQSDEHRAVITTIKAWNTRVTDAKYEKLVKFLQQEVAMRDYVCTTNHAVLLDNAKELLKEIGEAE